jgi:AAA+ ATPase superfamily predicted ATPase
MGARILMDATKQKRRKKTLERLVGYFPDWAEIIESEYRASQDFRALCEDFQVCALAKERWDQSDAPIAPQRRHEYAEWLEELLEEIKDWLKQSASAAGSV